MNHKSKNSRAKIKNDKVSNRLLGRDYRKQEQKDRQSTSSSKPMLWSSNNGTSEEFVVRRPSSARSVSSNKSKSSIKSKSLSVSVGNKKKIYETELDTNEVSNNTGHAQVDRLTDNIESLLLNDVKNSLKHSNANYGCDNSERDSSISEDEFENFQDAKPDTEKENEYLKNHCCSGCNALMINNHVPVILYPCGHTFCATCLEKAKFCPNCKMTISSMQQNSMLESIIMNYIDEKQRKEEQEKKERIEKLLIEMNNVDARCEVLQSEASSVIDSMETITEDIIKTENNMEILKDKASSIKGSIVKLQSKLENCEKEYSETDAKRSFLEEGYDKNKNQLIMIEKTMKSLQKNKQSIREMIENLNPSYFSDSD